MIIIAWVLTHTTKRNKKKNRWFLSENETKWTKVVRYAIAKDDEGSYRCARFTVDGSHVPSSRMVVENESAMMVTHPWSGSFDREVEWTRSDGVLLPLGPASYFVLKNINEFSTIRIEGYTTMTSFERTRSMFWFIFV